MSAYEIATSNTGATATVTVTEQALLVRSFEVPLAEGWDGRTLETRIVPYNQAATVADPPHFRPYQESFLPGAFARQLSTPGRDKVLLNFEHEQGIRGVVGQSLDFHDGEDGLRGSFGIHENTDGDKVLSMIHSGMLSGLSLEFRSLSSRRVDGVVQRLRAQLDKVSLCRYPAYPESQVLAVRAEPDEQPEPFSFTLERAAELDERLAAVGFEALEGSMDADELVKAAKALTRARRDPQAAAAARKLIRYYNAAGMEPPPGLRRLAGS